MRTHWHVGVWLALIFAGCREKTNVSVPNEPQDIVKNPAPNEVAPPRPIEAPPHRLNAELPARSAHPDDWFEDRTPQTGIRFEYRNGREAGRLYMIESFGGGVAMIDFDLDDQVDLFFTGGGTLSPDDPNDIAGRPSGLFRNRGDWRFDDATTIAALALPPEYSQGCAVTDCNEDGFDDLFVCCYGRSSLYLNQGDGTFEEATGPAVPPATGWATAAAFGDQDGDGFSDLFVARYTQWSVDLDVVCETKGVRDLCGPTSYPATRCQFLRNTGDGRFEDWSDQVGIRDGVHGLGVLVTDFDGDGRVDFYVSSDALPNHYYHGEPGGALSELALLSGVAYGEWGQPEASMGLDVADYDGDQQPDIFITNYEKEDNTLYRSTGGNSWMHATVKTGLSGVSRMRIGFGTAMSDFDSDGWADIFVLNGNPIYTTTETPYEQQPQLFRNQEGRRFVEVSEQGGPYFGEAHSGRGNAVGDLDNDGDLDMVTVLMNEPIRVLGNRKTPANYLRVLPIARFGESHGTGARVRCQYQGRTLTHFVKRGAGFFSEFDSRLIFPVNAEATTVDVTIEWPGRKTEVYVGLPVKTTHRLVEGQGTVTHE